MALQTFSNNEAPDASKFNNNFQYLFNLLNYEIYVKDYGSTSNVNPATWTTQRTDNFETDDELVYYFKGEPILCFISGAGNTNASFRLLFTFSDNTTKIFDLGTFTNNTSGGLSYSVNNGISSSKPIKTVEWQLQRNSGTATIRFNTGTFVRRKVYGPYV